jgi:hypothetical protein
LINVKVTIQEFTVQLVPLWSRRRDAFEMKKARGDQPRAFGLTGGLKLSAG